MAKKQNKKANAPQDSGERKPHTLLSDPSRKLNTEAGLLFGNHNTAPPQQPEEETPQQAETLENSETEASQPEAPVPVPQQEQEQKVPVTEQAVQLAHKARSLWNKKREERKEKRRQAPKAPEREPPAYRSKIPMAVVGLVIALFAVIGIIWTGQFVVRGIASAVRQDSLKETIKEDVYPLVIVDTPTFENPDTLDQKVVISAGIWKFIMEEPDADQKYETDDFGTMTVPQVAIEPYIRELFGSTVKIEHQMIPDTDFYIPYDAENQVYYIPQTPQILPYAPKILSVDHLSGDEYEVEVGYMLAGPFWDTQRYLEDEPSKIMRYTLQKNDRDSYQVLSVEQTVEDTTISQDDSAPEEDTSGTNSVLEPVEPTSGTESESGESALSDLTSAPESSSSEEEETSSAVTSSPSE